MKYLFFLRKNILPLLLLYSLYKPILSKYYVNPYYPKFNVYLVLLVSYIITLYFLPFEPL